MSESCPHGRSWFSGAVFVTDVRTMLGPWPQKSWKAGTWSAFCYCDGKQVNTGETDER